MATLFVPTRGRPELVGRLIRSLAQNEVDARLRIVVLDDRRDGDPEDGLCRRLNEQISAGPAIRIVDRVTRNDYAKRLAHAAGLDEQITQAALVGPEEHRWSVGCARNAALLLGAGTLLFMLDDDTVAPHHFPLHTTPNQALPAQRKEAFDPTEQWLYPSSDAVWQAVGNPCDSPLSAQLLETFQDGYGTEGGSVEGRVRVATLGLAGDCGMSSALYRMLIAGENRNRMFDNYAGKRLSRHCIRAVTRPTLTRPGFFMSPCALYDHRRLLPPFPPLGRNGDSAFARLLGAVDLHAWIAHLPYVIEHRPPSRPSFDVDALHRAGSSPSPNGLMSIALGSVVGRPPKTDAVQVELERVGREICELADLPSGVFRGVLRHHALQQARGAVAALSRTLDTVSSAPDDYVRDVRVTRDAIQTECGHEDYPYRSWNPGDADTLQTTLRELGTLYQCWPSLVDAAGTIDSLDE